MLSFFPRDVLVEILDLIESVSEGFPTYFEGMVGQIYPSDLQLNKAYASDTKVPIFDLQLSISNGYISSKIYDKRDEFDFDIVNFLFWMGTFPGLPLTVCTFLNLFDLLECLVM